MKKEVEIVQETGTELPPACMSMSVVSTTISFYERLPNPHATQKMAACKERASLVLEKEIKLPLLSNQRTVKREDACGEEKRLLTYVDQHKGGSKKSNKNPSRTPPSLKLAEKTLRRSSKVSYF